MCFKKKHTYNIVQPVKVYHAQWRIQRVGGGGGVVVYSMATPLLISWYL